MTSKYSLVFLASIVAIIIIATMTRLYNLNQPIILLIPNMLLFTCFRELTFDFWTNYVVINKKIKRHPTQIPEIFKEDYSFDAFKEATQNWRYPAVVRGLFNDTPALKKWLDPGYLPEKLGKYNIPQAQTKFPNLWYHDKKTIKSFEDSFVDIISNNNSKTYLFFPVQFFLNFHETTLEPSSIQQIQKSLDELVLEDLQIDSLIWNGFGTKKHKSYFGSQLIVGRGSNNISETTGSGWHCAPGNNWFAQVAGRKRWYFLDSPYSAYMYPLKGAKVNFITGNDDISMLQEYLPLRYVDLEPGDLLYNPDWEWHTIVNYDGVSIGVPMREVNLSLSYRNNFLYTSIIFSNKIASRFGIDIGGYPVT